MISFAFLSIHTCPDINNNLPTILVATYAPTGPLGSGKIIFNFLILYKVTSRQLVKEKAKFARKYESLNSDKVILAYKQSTNRTFVRTVADKI